MANSTSAWRAGLALLRHPRTIVVLAIVILIAVLWALPHREAHLSSVDRRSSWSLGSAPPRREIAWQPAMPVDGLLDNATNRSVIAPSLTDAGATLYCTLQSSEGQADIFTSRLTAGKWATAIPVEELNTPADEIGAIVTADSQRLYFYSDRPGGYGGFDLYVAVRKGDIWGQPRNLGKYVNSPAHEYDPAISPDGQRLYFASNRTEEMASRLVKDGAAEDGETKDGTARRPLATIRSHPGLAQFDLYMSHRSRDNWSPAEPIPALNTAGNEGAPAVSADGAFIYFASDRSFRNNEPTNLDLYRAPVADGQIGSPENLGSAINTAAHETEPGFSPEGYRIVFSSNRDGVDAIFSSTAMEVVETTRWDTARLATLRRVFPFTLLLTIGVLFVTPFLMEYKDPFVESAVAARFVGASFVLHAVIFFVLAYWSLPIVARVVLSQVQEASDSSQPFDNNQHQSHEDGLEAWEKLADVQALEKSVELNRREVTPVNLPSDSERLAPTISADLAHRLPPSKVLFEPPAQQAKVFEKLPQQALPKRSRPAPDRIQPIDDPIEAIVPVQAPAEKPMELATPNETERQETIADVAAVKTPPKLTALPLEPIELPELGGESPQPMTAENLPPRERADTTEQVVELVDESETAVRPIGEQNTIAAQVKQPNLLDRAAAQLPTPSTAALPAKGLEPFRPRPAAVAKLEPGKPQLRAAPSVALPVELPEMDDLATIEEPAPTRKTTGPNPGDVQVGIATVRLKTREEKPLLSTVSTPTSMSGPRLVNRPLSVGDIAENRKEVPPSFDPVASRLERRRASATRVAYAQDNVGIREMFTMRQGDVRKKHIKLLGSTDEAESVVQNGLAWLAMHQNEDGSWSLHQFHENCKAKGHANCSGAGNIPSRSAATGLALLPFLASGHTHKEGDYQQTIDRGLKWLVATQKDDGDLYAPGDQQHMYSHSIATIALCEAYGMSGDETLKPAAQKAIDFVVKSQHEPSGGWRYNPNEHGDTSVVGWATMALKSAEMAGLKPPQKSYDLVAKWLKRVEGNKPIGGTFGYQNTNATPAMTAEGLLCLQFMGAKHDDPRLRAGADYLLKNLPRADQKNTSYYWYYGTQAMFHMSGDYWQPWNEKLRDHLVTTQRSDGPMSGTWDPKDTWEVRAGRLYTTSLKLLMLEVYYRHLPLYNPQSD
jgi:hypothetical protein